MLEEHLGLFGQVAVEHGEDGRHLAALPRRQVAALDAEDVLQELARHGQQLFGGVAQVLGEQGEGEEQFVLQLLTGVLLEVAGESHEVPHHVAQQHWFLSQQMGLSLPEHPQQQRQALVELTSLQRLHAT